MLLQLALAITTSIVSCHKSVAASLKARVIHVDVNFNRLQEKYPVVAAALSLSLSPLLHGAPLDALQDFFRGLSLAGEPSLACNSILDVWHCSFTFSL